jgi:hypothetical protein
MEDLLVILYRNSLIKNCYVTGTADNPTVIKGTTTPSAIPNVGGFCGNFYGIHRILRNIYNCYVTYTSVYGSSTVGEFMGTIYTYSTYGYMVIIAIQLQQHITAQPQHEFITSLEIQAMEITLF